MLFSVPAGMSLSGCLTVNQARLGRMLELVMRAFDPHQKPAIGFELLDDLLAVHSGYYNHLTNKSNTITSLIQSGETLRFEGNVGDLFSLIPLKTGLCFV